MTQRIADYYPAKVNMHVPDCAYAAAVVHNGPNEFSLGTPPVLDADGILDGHSIATAGSTSTFNVLMLSTSFGEFGRNVTVVASGAATSLVTVKGRDYLGQPMLEDFTLNGTSPVVGVKAFKTIEEVVYGATGGTTIDVGWADKLGLPYAVTSVLKELEDGAVASAGTLVARSVATQSSTSADPRGTYDPASACDGALEFSLVMMCDRDNLHGVAHYYA